MNSPALIQEILHYSSNILRDHGLSRGDYVEPFTFLPFPQMAEEQSKSPFVGLRAQSWMATILQCIIAIRSKTAKRNLDRSAPLL